MLKTKGYKIRKGFLDSFSGLISKQNRGSFYNIIIGKWNSCSFGICIRKSSSILFCFGKVVIEKNGNSLFGRFKV